MCRWMLQQPKCSEFESSDMQDAAMSHNHESQLCLMSHECRATYLSSEVLANS